MRLGDAALSRRLSAAGQAIRRAEDAYTPEKDRHEFSLEGGIHYRRIDDHVYPNPNTLMGFRSDEVKTLVNTIWFGNGHASCLRLVRETGSLIGGNEMGVSTIYLAGGCFWGMQKFFDQFDGVTKTEVGYANGPDKAPSYQQVCSDSGHAETVRIDYEPDRISLKELLGYYFMVIDPLSVNRQGNDAGIQYRTGIYYTDESQLPEIEAVYRAEEEKAGAKLAVELTPIKNFFPAEEYHQKYLDKNPGGYCHIADRYFHLQ